MKKRRIAIIVVGWMALLLNDVLAQAPAAPPAAEPRADLKAEVKRPALCAFALDKEIEVHDRAAPADFGGVAFSPLEVRTITFKFDEKDNRLTATAACTAVRVLDCVRTVHAALFDEHLRLLGTASVSTIIKRFILGGAPASEPVELALDFGESPAYKACKSFQLSIAGRGRSSVKYGMKDADELFTRLADGRSPEGQRDAANALAALGAPMLPRLQALGVKENRIGRLALEAIAKIGTPEAVKILDDQLRSPRISQGRRLELCDLLSLMPPPAFEALSAEMEQSLDQELQVAVARLLAAMPDPRIGPFLLKCFQDEKRYYGGVRAELALALTRRNEQAAVPSLIAALRDSSGIVRMAAAYGLAQITSTDMPIEWEDSPMSAWMNAPPERRELAIKRWEEWWKVNSAKFGVR